MRAGGTRWLFRAFEGLCGWVVIFVVVHNTDTSGRLSIKLDFYSPHVIRTLRSGYRLISLTLNYDISTAIRRRRAWVEKSKRPPLEH